MLAQLFMSAAARAFAQGKRPNGASKDAAPLTNRSTKAPAFDRRLVRTRSSDRASMSLMQGEVVQLDAIGYSDEELIAREIKTHREAIALYEDKANGSDAQLRVFARQILPQLQQHLAMLETLKSEKPHAGR